MGQFLNCLYTAMMNLSVPQTMKTQKKGFVQYGVDESVSVDQHYEEFLVADREGLKYLRMKIEEVLEGADEVVFDSEEISVDLVGIRVAGRTIKDQAENQTSGRIWAFGCIVGLLLILFILVLGVWKVVELLAN